MAGGTAGGDATLILSFDLDKLAIGAGVTGLSSPLQKLLSQAPQGTQAALAWLPDLELSDAQTLLDLQTGDVGAYVAVADADGNQLASTFVFLTSVTGQPQAVIGLTVDDAVSLAGIPLFGALLSGVQFTGLGVSYATQDFPAGEFTLPSGPDGAGVAHPEVKPGFGLTITVDAGGSAQTFTLPAGSDGGSGSAALAARSPTAQDSTGPPVTWFTVQKSLGPLSVDRVGLVAGDGTVGLAIDAALDTDVVNVQLTGFTVDFAVATRTPSVSLDGLTVAVDASELQISGGLVRTQGPDGEEYDGALLISVSSYAINAVGAYATVDGAPSLFVFGIVKGEFGGPPAFFVTGLAAGFGVNRALRLPAPDQVSGFPIVEAAAGTGATDTPDALAKLNTGGWIPPTVGEYWVAAGVTFRSFELIDGFALVTVEFGKDLVIALLGAASLLLPTELDTGDEGSPAAPYAYVEITLEVVLRPKEGVFSLTALVSPNSYLIDPSCQLTGGIAVDVWFGDNPHAGDFVFTGGGYHPMFAVPAWYPVVPRLGFSWHVSDELHVAGENYFALTPACVMGGGLLSVTFAADGLRAWFTAQADFIMYWRPFFFDVDVSISIGVSYTGSIGFISATFTVELGVSVELWGPPVRGIAHVNWWVISFDVDINGGGSPNPNAGTLSGWDAFAKTSLPQSGNVCTARADGSPQGIVTTPSGESVWLFSGDGIALRTETLIPASQAVVTGVAGQAPTSLPGLTVNVYPLGNVTVASEHTVCVAAWTSTGTTWRPGQPLPAGMDVSGWGWAAITTNLPASLWGARGSDAQPPLAATVVPGVTGVAGAGQPTLTGGLTVQAGPLDATVETSRGLPLPVTAAGGPGPVTAGDTRQQVASTIDDPAVSALRSTVIAVANGSGLGAGLSEGALPLLAAEVYAVLTDQPMIGQPGTTGPPPPAARGAAFPAAGQRAPAAGPAAGGTEKTVPAAHTPQAAADGADLRAVFRGGRSVTIADRWATGRDHDLLAAAAQRPAEVWPAMTAVWDLPPDGRRTLRCDAATPVWIVALDAAQRPAQAWLGPAAADTPDLPAATTRVAVTAAGQGVADQGVAGWHGGTVLRQIASQALLGDGVVVRPQSPHAIPRRRSRHGPRNYRELGVTSGRDLVERTWTQHADGRVRRGWIETCLPSWCQWLVVATAPAPGAADGPDGDAAAAGVPGPRLTVRRLVAGEWRPVPVPAAVAQTRGTGSPSRWLFPVTGGTGAADQVVVVVRAWAPDGWRLDGVAGFAAQPAGRDHWPPAAAGVPSSDTPNRVWWE
jgi:hypothetical protein